MLCPLISAITLAIVVKSSGKTPDIAYFGQRQKAQAA